MPLPTRVAHPARRPDRTRSPADARRRGSGVWAIALVATLAGCERGEVPLRTTVPEALLEEIRLSRKTAARRPDGTLDWGWVDLRNVEARGPRLRVRTAWVEPPGFVDRMCMELLALARRHELGEVAIEGPEGEALASCSER